MSCLSLLPYCAQDAVTGKICPAALTNILEGGFEGKLHSCHPVVPETIASLIQCLVLCYLKFLNGSTFGVPCIEQTHLSNLQASTHVALTLSHCNQLPEAILSSRC